VVVVGGKVVVVVVGAEVVVVVGADVVVVILSVVVVVVTLVVVVVTLSVVVDVVGTVVVVTGEADDVGDSVEVVVEDPGCFEVDATVDEVGLECPRARVVVVAFDSTAPGWVVVAAEAGTEVVVVDG
jgi:hypothetical protein